MRNFYDVLGVSKDASLDEIKASHHRLAIQYHPDRAGQESTAKMQEIIDAYKTLSDPRLRADYDMKILAIDAIQKEDFLHDDGRLLPYNEKPSATIYEKKYDEYKLSFKARKKPNNLKELIDEYTNKETYTYNKKTFFSIYNLIHEKEIHHEPCAIEINPDRDFDISYVTELFTEFLNGNIFGLALESFKQNLAEVIKTSNYFAAVYGIISVNFTDKRTKNLLINSFNELTKYLINTSDELTHEQALLFASKNFHALQSLVHALFWKYLHNLKFKTPDEQTHTNFFIDYFDGSDECFEYLKYLKFAVNENDPRFLLFNNLMYFEMNVSNMVKGLEKASELRELAFKTLNWVEYLKQNRDSNYEILINMYLQAGAYLLTAAQREKNLPEKFADEKLAFDLFVAVVNFPSKPDALSELYILNNVIGLLLNVELIGAEIKDNLRSYIARFEKISSIYSIFQFIQSATALTKSVPQFKEFRKKFLKSIYQAYNNEAIEEDKNIYTITYKDILYEIYVCSLNGQYYHEINSDDFYKIRFELMNRVTQEHGYTIDSVSQNLGQPTVMVRRTDDGWLKPWTEMIPFSVNHSGRKRFRSLNSIEISFWSGDFNLVFLPGNNSPDTELFTLADVVHIFTRRITEARFSLDEVDHTQPYLPFYKMTFSPDTLVGTDFLRTLFLTDYLLKIFTVGQDVSSKPDFRLTGISELLKGLPEHLKSIIYNYHKAEPSENNTHRFWIETENAETLFKKFNYKKVITISDVKMVVKKQAMTRDKEGKLIDDVNAREGWDIYVLDPYKERNIFLRIFRILDTIITNYQYNISFSKAFARRCILSKDIRRPSIIINNENDHAFFIEDGKISKKYDLSALNQTIQELKKLARDRNDCVKFNGQKREIQEKIYESTLAISNHVKKKHYFSREYVFTYEFTQNYEEFGKSFPEFLRLRELSKICLYIEHLELIHSCVKDRQRGHNLGTDLLVSHTKLNKAFEKIGIGTYKEESPEMCTLVPASLNRQITAGRIHFSYGGVRVKPTSYPLHWREKTASEQFITKTTEKSVYKCSPDDYQSARNRFQKGNPPPRAEFGQEPPSSYFTRTQPQARTTGTYYTGSSAARASGGYQYAQTSGGGAAAAGASAGRPSAGGGAATAGGSTPPPRAGGNANGGGAQSTPPPGVGGNGGNSRPPNGAPTRARSISPRGKGRLGEAAGVATLSRAGYELLPTKLPRNQGFDHVGILRNPDGSIKEVCIVESKYSHNGKFKLGESGKGKQMSNKWIKATLEQMLESNDPDIQKTARIIQTNEDKCELRAHVLDKEGINRWKQATEVVRDL